ncbi:MAG TPA: M14 family metallopeptidase [Vicinamibacterales bacterium]|nr:M14 family metallopeptidase [Vicinamibacterales bacterium]
MRQALLLAVIVATSVNAQPPDLRTRAEVSNFEETSTYDDVMRIAKAVAAGSPLAHLEIYGRTEEGREMPLLVLSEPGVTTPEAARKLARPIVFIQGNIHAGEVEGKEAALILARRLTQGDLGPMLQQLVVLIAPIYNADGNEKFSLQNRAAQYGPIGGVGTRENSNGLDLNRDHMKLDSAEARAFAGLLNRWDPHVGIDLHTTNGSYHGYHLTYSPSLNPNADPRIIALARERILPATGEAVRKKHGFRTYYYGNFASESGKPGQSARVDPANPGDTIWRTFDHRPRFNNNYLGLRNRLAILSEAYSYVEFRDRVRVTEVFVEESLNAVAANAKAIMTLTSQLDGETRSYAGATAKLPGLGVAFRIAALPAPVEILVGVVEKKTNPRSGREMLAMGETVVPVRMKDYGVFEAMRSVTMPQGWLIPRPHVESSAYATALERLRTHGVQVRRVVADAELMVERFVIDTYTRAQKPFQNRYEARLTGKHETAKLSAQEGALFIPANQPLARLAFYLLEPESDDGFVTWNLIEAGLSPGATYPIYRVTGGVLETQ